MGMKWYVLTFMEMGVSEVFNSEFTCVYVERNGNGGEKKRTNSKSWCSRKIYVVYVRIRMKEDARGIKLVSTVSCVFKLCF